MTNFRLPMHDYHWSIVSYKLLSAYLKDYHLFGYEIISVSAYGWLNPRVLIVYSTKLV
jgi:hypothetical protein